MASTPAIEITGLSHAYGERLALDRVSITVARAEIFAVLGPNGGGKSTLFRILATLLPPSGAADGGPRVFGLPVTGEPAAVRRRIGVVFQQPALDPKLTVLENLIHHGHLFGMRGRALRERAAALLDRFGVGGRKNDWVETLSGGLARRAELAKALLPRPDLLLLDEPSAGLDPGARQDFIGEIERLRREEGTSVLLTTHFMEEADRCDRVGILNEGKLVALGRPEELKGSLGGEVVVIQAADPADLREKLRGRFGCDAKLVDGTLRVERPRAHEFIPQLIEAYPGAVKSLTFGRPTLEDVFVHETGRRFWTAEGAAGERAEEKKA